VKKPFIFAIRGMVGFGMTGVIVMYTLMWMLIDRLPGSEIPPWLAIAAPLGTTLLAGAGGAFVLTFGIAHWKRATLGFALSCIPTVVISFYTTGVIAYASLGSIRFGCAALGWGVGFALLGGIGGFCLRRDLAWPGAVAFGMPGAFFGLLGMLVPDPVMALLLIAAPLAMGGGIFGIALGWPVLAKNPVAFPTPPPPD
jgi:hypothetical protein